MMRVAIKGDILGMGPKRGMALSLRGVLFERTLLIIILSKEKFDPKGARRHHYE